MSKPKEFDEIIHCERIGDSLLYNHYVVGELVRCRYCAYRVEANTSDGSAWCSQLDGLMPPDWFCADGERKEE